jgi:RNA polymerase sigma-70 factor (ECF subfamily)
MTTAPFLSLPAPIPIPAKAGPLDLDRSDWIWNRNRFAAYKNGNMEKAAHFAANALEDEKLMLRVAQGDRSAFLQLYDRLSTPLYSLALRMLANEAEAQDILQEVFLSIWSKAANFRADRGTPFSWAVTQLRSRAIDRIRSQRRRGELVEAYRPDLEPSGSATTSSAENCEVSERAREVRSALGQLTEDQREVLRMAYFEGLSQSEIAEKLEEPLGTIKARAHRGMARLRTLLRFLHE